MSMRNWVVALMLATSIAAGARDNTALNEIFAEISDQGVSAFAGDKGEQLWTQRFQPTNNGTARSCSSCHTDDPTRAGKHIKTGKPIDPLAPSAQPDRLTDAAKIRKWMKRNCKWTLGRECTAQEQGDLLTYLNQL